MYGEAESSAESYCGQQSSGLWVRVSIFLGKQNLAFTDNNP